MKCKCGCGKTTSIIKKTSTAKGDVKGEHQQYIQGHHARGSNHYAWRGGRTKSHGYVLIYIPAHPFCDHHGYVREHRLIMEQKIGRFLQPKEQVHHINGIKDDNRVKNLVLTNIYDHFRLYHPDILKKNHFKVGHKRKLPCVKV